MSFLRSFIGGALVLWCVVVSSSAQNLRINEILADNQTNLFSDGSISDWVEFYNPTAEPIALAGYSLSDTATNPRKWVFPANVSIPANGYLVVLLDSSRPASTTAGPVLNSGFSIKATGDRLDFFSPLTQVVDSVRYGPQARNYSIGRIPSGTGDFVLTQPTPGAGNVTQTLGAQAALRINEWMASPSSGSDWFEIYNSGTLPVALTGLYFVDSANKPSPVAPYSFIGGGLDGFLQIFADNSTNDNEVDFGLGGSGDAIGLHFANNTVIDRVEFGQQLAGISQGRLPDGTGAARSLNTATPGESNLIRYEGLVVSELLSHSDLPLEDAVEFYNQTDAPINIGGWYLSDSRNDLKRYRIADGTVVPARGYIVFYEYQFNGASAATPFSFNSYQGDEIYLSQTFNGELTGAIVSETFEAAENGVSFGRVETSVPGDHKFVALISRTFGVANPTTVEEFRTGTGQANTGPRVGPLSVTEVMYNPVSPDGGITDNTLDEFIELKNIASTNVALFDPAHPENRWIIRGGVSYTFPANTTLPVNEVVLLVSFDPANVTQVASFRSKYSVPQGIAILGPYIGKLGNGGDQVELYRPDPPQAAGQPDPGFVPYIRVDKVNYSDVAPWPSAADGTGMSLQRKNATLFGNDPINWEAAAPTAGRYGSGGSETTVQISGPGGIGAPVTLQFNTVPGSSYTVQQRDSLASTASWAPLSSTNAVGSSVTVQDSSGAPQRFYRIVTPAQ